MKTIKTGDDSSAYASGNYNCKTSTTGTSIPKQKPKELDWELNKEQKEWLLDVLNTKSDNALKVILINGLISKTLTQQRTELLEEIEKEANKLSPIVGNMKHNEAVLRLCNISLNLLNKKDE